VGYPPGEITIGDSCMMAHGAYITDADWHGLYDRSDSAVAVAPVRLGNNVWIGDSAIVCKGVTIGDHSVVGAGSVVTRDVPPYTVVAGNPASFVKELDPALPMKTRGDWMADPRGLRRVRDHRPAPHERKHLGRLDPIPAFPPPGRLTHPAAPPAAGRPERGAGLSREHWKEDSAGAEVKKLSVEVEPERGNR
jgi:hypothetical protein